MLSTALHPGPNPYSIRSHREGVTILLVNKEPANLTLVKEILIREGYKVIATASSLSALDSAAKNSFNMLVIDYEMKDMNGFVRASCGGELYCAARVRALKFKPEQLPVGRDCGSLMELCLKTNQSRTPPPDR